MVMRSGGKLGVLGFHDVAFGLADVTKQLTEPRCLNIEWLTTLNSLKLDRPQFVALIFVFDRSLRQYGSEHTGLL